MAISMAHPYPDNILDLYHYALWALVPGQQSPPMACVFG